MISSFSLKVPPQIVFGPGKLAELQQIVLRFGRKPLLVFGKDSFAKTSHHHSLLKMFSKLGIPTQTVHIGSEPSPEMIDRIVADKVKSDIDMVIAIGGGSVLDGGKAISVMLVEGGGVSRFLEGVGSDTPSGRKLPFIAIPTTSGTGSEATSNAVISSVGRNGFKKSLRHDNFIPNLALIDPTLTLSCPKAVTVACSMDCFSQLVEGYLSTRASSLTDALALEGIRAISRSLRLVCADGDDLQARTDLSYGALLSGIVLANAGLGTVHGFASVIGGLVAIPHGLICGSLMAASNEMTLRNLRANSDSHTALSKYTQLGKIFSHQQHKKDTWYQDYFIDLLKKLSAELGISKLPKCKLTEADIEQIVTETDNKYNPAPLTRDELRIVIHSSVDSQIS